MHLHDAVWDGQPLVSGGQGWGFPQKCFQESGKIYTWGVSIVFFNGMYTHHGESSPFLKVTQAVHMEMFFLVMGVPPWSHPFAIGITIRLLGYKKPVIHDDWMTGIPHDFGNLHFIYHYQPLLTTLNHCISSISPSYHISIHLRCVKVNASRERSSSCRRRRNVGVMPRLA